MVLDCIAVVIKFLMTVHVKVFLRSSVFRQVDEAKIVFAIQYVSTNNNFINQYQFPKSM